MNRFIFLLLPLFSGGLLGNLKAQTRMEIRRGDTIKCFFHASSSASHSEQKNSTNKSWNNSSFARTATTNFEVSFTGFPTGAQAAVQKAIDIWSASLKSDVKIKIFATWTVNTNNPNNLAFVVPTEVRNFPGAPQNNIWYPMTLAEKIAGIDLNSKDEADIVATFNAGRTDWYFGTDGNCPFDKYDLVTIALHELGHGLGFSGTFFSTGGSGSFGANGTSQAKIYDTYIYNGADKQLVNQNNFPNPSFALGTQITGNSLIFKSDLAALFNSSSYPRIYAPNPYNPGSSISHLDESTYNNSPNSLLTPFAASGEVRHSIGPLVRGIFYEMGWLYTYLSHSNFTDKESLVNSPLILNVKSDTAVNSASGKLYYSFDGFSSSNNIPLTFLSGNSWSAEIPMPPIESTVSYYFTFSDVFNKVYRYPLDDSKYVQFFYGVDKKKPTINHQPITEIVEFQKNIVVSAEVKDNIGVQKVEIEYQVNSGSLKKKLLSLRSADTYETLLDLSADNIKGGDKIKYRIIALDVSSQANESFSPNIAFYSIDVRLFEPKDVFISDLNIEKREFFGDFSIMKPVGFSNSAIHSPHPYPKAQSGLFIDLTYSLLYPIRIKNKDSFLEWDEVVLVEPVNDYVVVEGTNDNGITWSPLKPSYDSRSNSDWLNYFNSNIQAGDSKSLGTLNFFKPNKIDLLNVFKQGDVIFIRFRLRANSTATGWGWAIDNLRIQDQVVGFEDSYSLQWTIYPNPFQSKVIVDSPIEKKYTKVMVFSLLGQEIGSFQSELGTLEIDTSLWPPAFYIFKLVDSEKGLSVSKKLVKIN